MIDSYYDGLDKIEAHNTSPDFFKISPSSISRFFSSTRQWYGENFLDEDAFQGSTSSILGSVVHYFAEQAALGIRPSDPDQLVSDYLDAQTVDFDRSEVESLWRDMANTLNAECVFPSQPNIDSVEQFIFEPILPGVYVGGTYDALIRTSGFPGSANSTFSVRDYKTTAKKPSGFSYDYRMQLTPTPGCSRRKATTSPKSNLLTSSDLQRPFRLDSSPSRSPSQMKTSPDRWPAPTHRPLSTSLEDPTRTTLPTSPRLQAKATRTKT